MNETDKIAQLELAALPTLLIERKGFTLGQARFAALLYSRGLTGQPVNFDLAQRKGFTIAVTRVHVLNIRHKMGFWAILSKSTRYEASPRFMAECRAELDAV